MLAIATVLPSSAAAQGRLSPVSRAPVTATFEPEGTQQKAQLAVTVRNDSRRHSALVVRLVLADALAARR